MTNFEAAKLDLYLTSDSKTATAIAPIIVAASTITNCTTTAAGIITSGGYFNDCPAGEH